MMIISLTVESNDGLSFAAAIVDGTKSNRCESSFARSVSENNPISFDCVFCCDRVSTSADSTGSSTIVSSVCLSTSPGSTTPSAADSSNATVSLFAVSAPSLPDVTNTSAFISGICMIASIMTNNIEIIFFFTMTPLFHFHSTF